MAAMVTIENGFAEIGAGVWLMGRAQPAAFFGALARRRRKGFFLRDRAHLDLVETTAKARLSDATRPFLTHIPCAAPLSAVSPKVLLAPADAWTGAELVRVVPMSLMRALCVSAFDHEWALMATSGRTARIAVDEGDTLSVRPDAVVAWTGPRPTGFCPRLRLSDVLLPRGPRDLLLHFHGPAVVWVEGSQAETRKPKAMGRYYGA